MQTEFDQMMKNLIELFKDPKTRKPTEVLHRVGESHCLPWGERNKHGNQ